MKRKEQPARLAGRGTAAAAANLRHWARTWWLGAVGAVACLGSVHAAGSREGPGARPNIVFIMADDHNRQSISAYGGRYAEIAPTPNIDRLAKEGMRFDHATSPNSICVPARAALLTGRHSHLNGVKTNRDAFDGQQLTFPKILQQAGYQTALFGKWHLQSQPTGFDYYAVIPGQGKFIDCAFLATGEPWNAKGNSIAKGYLTDVITDRAIDWLKQQSREKPFCLLVHHKAPHVPHTPAPRHAEFLAGQVLPEPPNLYDTYAGRALQDAEQTARWSRLALCAEGEYQPLVRMHASDRAEATRQVYQEFMRGYLRLVKSLDENVGRLLDYLEASGLARNTVVIYTSDNGFFNGEHGLYNKMWMYEESLHVPLLVRHPGVTTPGSRCHELVSLLDLAPTLAELAGAEIPADFQGGSLVPLWQGKEVSGRDHVYYHYYEAFGVPEHVGIRTVTHKIVYYPTLGSTRWELFDLQRDPQEMSNLAGVAAFRPLFEKMQRELVERAAASRDPISRQIDLRRE